MTHAETTGPELAEPKRRAVRWRWRLVALGLVGMAAAIVVLMGTERLNKVEQQLIGRWVDAAEPERLFEFRPERALHIYRGGKRTWDDITWRVHGDEFKIVQTERVSSGASVGQRIHHMARNTLRGYSATFRLELKEDEIELTVVTEGGAPVKDPSTVVLRRMAAGEKRLFLPPRRATRPWGA